MSHLESTPTPADADCDAISASISAYIGRSVHFIDGHPDYMDAERQRGALHSAGVEADTMLGIAGPHLWIVVVPVHQYRRARRALVEARDFEARAGDRAPLHPEHRPAPAMPDGGEQQTSAPTPLRRVPPARSTREAMARLLHARVGSLHELTGELESEIRRAACLAATGDRAWQGRGGPVASSKATASGALDTDELAYAVSHVEEQLRLEGFDFDAADAAYQRRCALRARADAEDGPAVRSAMDEERAVRKSDLGVAA